MEEIKKKICAELYQAQFCLSYQYLGVRDLHILRNPGSLDDNDYAHRGGSIKMITYYMTISA